MNLILERFAYSPDGTFGRLLGLNLDTEIFTCERPWLGNKPRESCIPEGVYLLKKRPSPIVYRTSNGEYEEGWEVTDVPGRSLIMIHPANWPSELAGCIAPGLKYRTLSGKNAVTSSRDAFKLVMEALRHEDFHSLEILPYRAQYP